jgi:hypothetical protein
MKGIVISQLHDSIFLVLDALTLRELSIKVVSYLRSFASSFAFIPGFFRGF